MGKDLLTYRQSSCDITEWDIVGLDHKPIGRNAFHVADTNELVDYGVAGARESGGAALCEAEKKLKQGRPAELSMTDLFAASCAANEDFVDATQF